MKNETLKKVIEQIKKYELTDSFVDVEGFKKWVSELDSTQINSFLSLNIDPKKIKRFKNLLVNTDLLDCDDYNQRITAMTKLKSDCYTFYDVYNPNFLKSDNFYRDIEILSKTNNSNGLWVLGSKDFINSPYHEEDLKLLVEAHDTEKEKPLDFMVKDAIAMVASSAASIKSPYHQADIKMIATAGSSCLEPLFSCWNAGLNYLATNGVSLADKYHLENMKILSTKPEFGSYLCAVMTDPDIIEGENYRREVDVLMNAKSIETCRALYYYIANPDRKISNVAYPISVDNCVSGKTDPDYLNNLVRISKMDDKYVVNFAILLLNLNFINSQYKNFDLELLQNVDNESTFANLCMYMMDESSSSSIHHKKDAVIISKAQEEDISKLLVRKATDKLSIDKDDHDYDMEYISKLNMNEIGNNVYYQISYYLFNQKRMEDSQRKQKLEKLSKGELIKNRDVVSDYLDILQSQIENATSPIIKSVSDVDPDNESKVFTKKDPKK